MSSAEAPRRPSLMTQLEMLAPSAFAVLSDWPVDRLAPPLADAAYVAMPRSRLDALLVGVDLAVLGAEAGPCSLPRYGAFVAGRLCAELCLRELCGKTLHVGRFAGGAPAWPPGWQGSIAHDDDYAVAVAVVESPGEGPGVDVERFVDPATRADIATVCLTPHEQGLLARSAMPEIEATLRFSAKEAYYKAVHSDIGRFVDFDEVEVDDVDWAARRFVVRAVAPAGALAPPLPTLYGGFAFLGDGLLTWTRNRAREAGTGAVTSSSRRCIR